MVFYLHFENNIYFILFQYKHDYSNSKNTKTIKQNTF